MFIALYRWKLKDGQEERFREGWRRRTESIYQKYGSFGSRLHQADDDTWLAYAQWPDKETYFAPRVHDNEDDFIASAMMRDSIEVSYPTLFMDVVDDLLKKE